MKIGDQVVIQLGGIKYGGTVIQLTNKLVSVRIFKDGKCQTYEINPSMVREA